MVSRSIGTEERMMIKRLAVLLSVILILGLGFNYGAWAQSAAPEAPPVQLQAVGSATVVTFHGKIVALIPAGSWLHLRDRTGRE